MHASKPVYFMQLRARQARERRRFFTSWQASIFPLRARSLFWTFL